MDMNKDNVIKQAFKIGAQAGFNSKLADAKIEVGFIEGDEIQMGCDRVAKIENGMLVGYNKGVAEGSYKLSDLPEETMEQLMAAYILANCR
jgi:hypothetical protein